MSAFLLLGAYCEQQVVSCDCNSPCGLDQVCNMVNGAPVCGCPPCYTGEYCDVLIDSCECNNQCINRETCQDVNGGTQCVCDCQGNEECRNDPITNQPVCKCPLCYTNQPGASGCLTPVQHLCVCKNPCTADQQVCVDGSPGGRPVCKIGNPSSGNAFTVVFEENDSEKSFREVSVIRDSIRQSFKTLFRLDSDYITVCCHCPLGDYSSTMCAVNWWHC